MGISDKSLVGKGVLFGEGAFVKVNGVGFAVIILTGDASIGSKRLIVGRLVG